MTDVAARDLIVRLGGVPVLDGVNLAARPGEVTAVIGPNGAGKTTLLAALAGDIAITGGEVTLGGSPVASLSPGELATRRSVLRQKTMHDVPYRVSTVVELGRSPHLGFGRRITADDAGVVEEAMRRADLMEFADRLAATLSGGERRRVDLARVLAQQAPILLLDEPTEALDLGHAERAMRELRVEAERGNTVVVVLHDLNVAARHADQVVLLAQGEVVASGESRRVLTEAPLAEIYRLPVRVVPHPDRDVPLIVI